MNIKIKIISLILVIALCCSFVSACGGGGDDSSSTTPVATYEGIHDYTAPIRANEYIVKDGTSRYQIVVANDASKHCLSAAKELVQFFNEATGIQLSVITESETGLTHSAGQYYISIGNTKLWQSIKEERLEVDTVGVAVRIITKDTNIYISSIYDENNIFGVYDFLQILFNYEYYAKDCWEIDKNVKTLELRDFNVVDIPDVKVRTSTWNYLSTTDDMMARNRFRYNTSPSNLNIGDLECPDVAARRGVHTTEVLLPKTAVTNEDKWQADGNQQLCYTAHGDAESYDRMTSRAAYVIEQSLIDYPRDLYPNYNHSVISCADHNNSCGCEACGKANELYGSKAGAGIKFTNDVMAKIKAWMELPENEPYKRPFYLLFMAYFAYKTAPTHYDEAQGKYVVNHPDCQPREDVGVYYAQDAASYITSMYDSRNKSAYERLKAWMDITPNFSYYLYEADYVMQIGFWDTFTHYDSKGYNLYASAGNVLNYYAEVGGSEGITNFDNLKIYLASKLLWDSTLDEEVLMDKYFNAMYGEVAPIMRRFFDDARYYSNYVFGKSGVHNGHGFYTSVAKSDWSMSALSNWISIFDEAYETAEKIYKIALPEQYAKIKHHIDMEYVFPASYVLDCFSLETYGERYLEIAKYLQGINDEVGKFSYSHLDEMGSWNDLWMSIDVGD